jgi:hypothetical protein
MNHGESLKFNIGLEDALISLVLETDTTNYVGHTASCEVNGPSAAQEVPDVSMNARVH